MMTRPSLAVGLAVLALTCASVARADGAPAAKVDYIKDVKPIFDKSCVKCHSLDAAKPKKKAAAEFRLDDKTAMLKGGRSGKAIIPGDSKNSLLSKLLSGPVPRPVKDGDDDKDIDPMPKAKKGEKWKPLSDDQVAVIRAWIDQGANMPD
jgi:mono/diheme cytochrome c family protein